MKHVRNLVVLFDDLTLYSPTDASNFALAFAFIVFLFAATTAHLLTQSTSNDTGFQISLFQYEGVACLQKLSALVCPECPILCCRLIFEKTIVQNSDQT